MSWSKLSVARPSRVSGRFLSRSTALGLRAVLLAAVLAVSAGAQSPPAASGPAAFAHVTALSQQIGSRPAGSPAFVHATEYVTEQFQRLGYRVETQTFPFQFFDETEPPELMMLTPLEVSLHPATMLYSTPTPKDGVEAELADVGLGREEDLRGKRLDGKVALAQRGQIRFAQKASFAAAAGASAIIIINNQLGPAQTGTLLEPSRIPVVMVPYDEGLRLGAWLAAGPVRVRLVVRLGIHVQRMSFGSSDHESFEKAGIPVVFIHTGDDNAYHTPQDVSSRIDPQLLAQAASLAAAVVLDIAR